MLRILMTFFMVILIAMQSVAALADIHQIHQSQIEHFNPETQNTSHDTAEFVDDILQDKYQTNFLAFDCNHCCHCHGVTYLFLPGNSYQNSLLFQLSNNPVNYQPQYSSFIASPDNPPPIQS